MNYMEQIAQMLGVEFDEPFDMDYGDIQIPTGHNYYLTKSGVKSISGGACAIRGLLSDLLIGAATIVKRPWSPKEGDTYYYVDLDEDVIVTQYNPNNIHDVMNVRARNCYRTAEEVTPELMEQWGAWYMGGACPVRG